MFLVLGFFAFKVLERLLSDSLVAIQRADIRSFRIAGTVQFGLALFLRYSLRPNTTTSLLYIYIYRASKSGPDQLGLCRVRTRPQADLIKSDQPVAREVVERTKPSRWMAA